MTTLATLPKSKIEELRSRPFYCPSCNQPVIIKAGTQIIPHFAHRQNTICPANEQGESAAHEKGKLLLFNWLKSQGYTVLLEAYLSEINQRPDLLIIRHNKKIAIEYQCARVPLEQIQKRNQGYRKLGIIPIWILGANHFQRIGGNLVKMNLFTLQFLHQFTSPEELTLYYFDPTNNYFIMVQDLYVITTKKAIAKLNVKNLNDIRFPHLFQYHKLKTRDILKQWQKEKYTYRMKRQKHLTGRKLVWQHWLYNKGKTIDQLPSAIFLPISTQYVMKTPTWDWQSRIALDIIDPIAIGEQFSMQDCMFLLKNHFHSKSQFTLIHAFKNPVKQYLKFLCYLNIIQQTSKLQYKKVNHFRFYQQLEEAITGDKQLIDTLLSRL